MSKLYPDYFREARYRKTAKYTILEALCQLQKQAPFRRMLLFSVEKQILHGNKNVDYCPSHINQKHLLFLLEGKRHFRQNGKEFIWTPETCIYNNGTAFSSLNLQENAIALGIAYISGSRQRVNISYTEYREGDSMPLVPDIFGHGPFLKSDLTELGDLFRMLERNAGEEVSESPYLLKVPELILAYLIEKLPQEQTFPEKLTRKDTFRMLCHALELDFRSDTGRDALSRQFELSGSYITRLFKEFTGKGVSEYLTLLRMRYAIHAVTRLGHPVDDLAKECGFQDSAYFIRVFRKRYGITPGEAQKRVRLGQELPGNRKE